jgi:hypothetical protein
LSGAIDFRFPDGFQLPAGEFVVVAAAPADVQQLYGLAPVLGPYTNALPNEGGTVRLRNNLDAIRLEVNYADEPPWPAAADGAGHSLVLAWPSYGEGSPRAWAASAVKGGSPGELDALDPVPQSGVVINEFLAHTDLPQLDFLELYNHANTDVDLSGCWLTDDPVTNKFRIPNNTSIPARGFLSFNELQLGFALNAAGESLLLLSSNATRVLDAVRFGGQESGVASGRSPDGAATVRRLAAPTPGAANAAERIPDIVIHEIMYHPISGDSNDEYVELYNRSAIPVSLAGWRFVEGIDFRFPTNTTLAAGAYLVLAKNVARLLTRYPQLNPNNTVGDYDGSLDNAGERLALAMPDTVLNTNELGAVTTNRIHIVVTEAAYASGGRWGLWADGGGSSLELVDPEADPLRAANWADSDETQKAPWTSVSLSGKLDFGQGTANRFHILMQGPGECLVDDVEFIGVAGTNLLVNGTFENATPAWSFFGNHSRSTLDTTGAASGSRCLHVRGQGDGDTGINSIRYPITAPAANSQARLRAKVRWLAGWPEVLFRTRGNWIEMSARMAVPSNLGTPGLPNSRRVNNAGPAIYDVTHTPALPRANQAVVVTCRAADPHGLGALHLLYRTDPNTVLSTVPMRDDGTGGDTIAGDGLYSGRLPGQAARALVAFRVEATDAAASPATSLFPANAPAQECLVRWDDTVPFGTLAHYHLWSTQATEAARRNALDNTYRDATLVYGTYRVLYNVGFRDKGSPFHAGAGDFAVTVPPDDLLLGARDRVFAATGNGGSEATAIRSQLAAWLGQQLEIPYLHAHYLRLYRNGNAYQNVLEDLEQPNNNYAEAWFPDAGEGDLYKVAVWFEFDDSNSGFTSTSATLQSFLTTGNIYKLARYRWNFQRRPNDGTANNYTNLFDLVAAAPAQSGGHGTVDARPCLQPPDGELGRLDLQRRPEHVLLQAVRGTVEPDTVGH